MLSHGYVDPDEPHESVKRRFWLEHEAAVYWGARMTVLPPRYFRADVLTREEALRINPDFWRRAEGEPNAHEWLGAGLASHMAGMSGGMPDAAEFLRALAAKHPDGRQEYMVAVWLEETDTTFVWRAWLEGSYSWAELSAAAGRCGGACCKHGLLINTQHIHGMIEEENTGVTIQEEMKQVEKAIVNLSPNWFEIPGPGRRWL